MSVWQFFRLVQRASGLKKSSVILVSHVLDALAKSLGNGRGEQYWSTYPCGGGEQRMGGDRVTGFRCTYLLYLACGYRHKKKKAFWDLLCDVFVRQ